MSGTSKTATPGTVRLTAAIKEDIRSRFINGWVIQDLSADTRLPLGRLTALIDSFGLPSIPRVDRERGMLRKMVETGEVILCEISDDAREVKLTRKATTRKMKQTKSRKGRAVLENARPKLLQGKRMADVASELGVTTNALRYQLRKWGIPINTTRRRGELAVALLREGMMGKEVAEKLGTSASVLTRTLASVGTSVRKERSQGAVSGLHSETHGASPQEAGQADEPQP